MAEINGRKVPKRKKKWTEEELNVIINYLEDSTEVEAPTAQIYYKKLIETTGIKATWDLIRWKVRHLKSTYKKACDWRKSTGAGVLETDCGISTVEGKMLQICPHFHKLSAIFGEKRVDDMPPAYDSGDFLLVDETVEFDLNTITNSTMTSLESETIRSIECTASTEQIAASSPLEKINKYDFLKNT